MIELIKQQIKRGPAVKLAQQIEGLVRQGRIPPEALLPPVRDVARALRVSPGPAAAAYKSPRAQGPAATDAPRGTPVAPRAAHRGNAAPPSPPGPVGLPVVQPRRPL